MATKATASEARPAGLRPTRARRAVLEALRRARGRQLTVQDLHQQARAIEGSLGLATVYRTIGALAEAGVVDVVSQEHGETTYRLCSPTHHHHLICTGCGKVIEIEECDLGTLERRLSRRYRFKISDHAITLRGLCARCS